MPFIRHVHEIQGISDHPERLAIGIKRIPFFQKIYSSKHRLVLFDYIRFDLKARLVDSITKSLRIPSCSYLLDKRMMILYLIDAITQGSHLFKAFMTISRGCFVA